MSSRQLSIMFLGERRISWEAIKLLHTDLFRDHFRIGVLVTNDNLWDAFSQNFPVDGVVFLRNNKRHVKEILRLIDSERIDVLMSVQHNWILPYEIIKKLNGQAFNLHNSKLPDYKGYNSISHAILNGDEDYESTVHWMFEEVDSGDLAYVERTPILPDDTALTLYRKTIKAAVCAFERLLLDLRDNKPIPRTPINGKEGNFYGRDSLADLYDASAITNADELCRRARALYFPPLNNSFIVSNGAKIHLIPENGKEEHVATTPANHQLVDQRIR